MTTPPDDLYDVRLLKASIERSGLPARVYAVKVLMRNERTVRRWLAGDSTIPMAVVRKLHAEQEAFDAERVPR